MENLEKLQTKELLAAHAILLERLKLEDSAKYDSFVEGKKNERLIISEEEFSDYLSILPPLPWEKR